jgi:5'-nucleotidase
MEKRQILLTNDDGIHSPGLWAAAEALSDLGYVTVVAPRDQSSGMSRSLPMSSDGIIQAETMRVRGKDWTVYSVGGTPAQAVLHGLLEIMTEKPDLVVSGINYGENVATSVTISGTLGAAMEAASQGFPSLAASLETDRKEHLFYSQEIDFSTAAYFTALFARKMLEKHFPPEADFFKIDVPSDATPLTQWQVTRLAHQRYFVPVAPKRKSWNERGPMDYKQEAILDAECEDSDVYVLRVKRQVSLTPLSLDFTARLDLNELNGRLHFD